MDPQVLSYLISEDITCNNGLVLEDLDKKIPHLIAQLRSKKSPMAKWPEEKIEVYLREKVAPYDPTSGKDYMPYMAKQVKFNNIAFPEDGTRIRRTLENFHNIKTGWMKKKWAQWQQEKADETPGTQKLKGIEVNQFKNWRELEKAVSEFMEAFKDEPEEGEVGSEEMSLEDKVKTHAEKGSKKVLEFSMKAKREGKVYDVVWKLFEITNEAAAVVFGSKARWCTAQLDLCYECDGKKVDSDGKPCSGCRGLGHSQYPELKYMEFGGQRGWAETAHRYLQQGPLYMVTKNDELYLQTDDDWDEFMNVEDEPLTTCSPALDFFLGKVLTEKVVKSENAVNSIQYHRKLCVDTGGNQINYKGRVPTDLGEKK